MSNTVIKVESLSKKYIIGHQRTEGYQTFRDTISAQVKSWGRRLAHPFRSSEGGLMAANETEEFYALKDVSFEINRGDRVGIIGRNGAGKSTLLKILSRITEPTSGRIEIDGRVASLLEVGTGFHPELTGRENIFLNGAILGMTREEIRRKFDEIVDFAEIEKFLDTPVKRYSSGMYVRLAFAVAAHLETEILIVDEVLAVGDVQFQKKCMGKMGEVGIEGKTILLVSHNMNAIENLCNKAMLLKNGRIDKINNDIRSVTNVYNCKINEECKKYLWKNNGDKFANDYFVPYKLYLSDDKGNIIERYLNNNDNVYVCIEGCVNRFDESLQIGYALYTHDNVLLYWTCQTDVDEDSRIVLKPGHCILKSQIPRRFLNEGDYRVDMILALYFRQWILRPEANSPSIDFSIVGGLSDSSYWIAKRPGLLAPVCTWRCFSV